MAITAKIFQGENQRERNGQKNPQADTDALCVPWPEAVLVWDTLFVCLAQGRKTV